jgi:hypothetical protein
MEATSIVLMREARKAALAYPYKIFVALGSQSVCSKRSVTYAKFEPRRLWHRF